MTTVQFRPAPPLVLARRYAIAELRRQATDQQVAWLYDHPLPWLRALIALQLQVDRHIAQDRLALGALKPLPGSQPTADYMRAKRAADSQHAKRLHFRQLAADRMDDVESLIGDGPLDRTTAGDVARALAAIAQLLDDDEVADARAAALYWASRLAGTR